MYYISKYIYGPGIDLNEIGISQIMISYFEWKRYVNPTFLILIMLESIQKSTYALLAINYRKVNKSTVIPYYDYHRLQLAIIEINLN